MGAAIGIGITLGVIGGYLYLNWFIGTRIAFFITDLFAKENDDEVISYDEDRGMGHSVITPVTRGGQRFKNWFFLVVFPSIVYLNYRFWETIWATLEYIGTTLVRFAAQFL